MSEKPGERFGQSHCWGSSVTTLLLIGVWHGQDRKYFFGSLQWCRYLVTGDFVLRNVLSESHIFSMWCNIRISPHTVFTLFYYCLSASTCSMLRYTILSTSTQYTLLRRQIFYFKIFKRFFQWDCYCKISMWLLAVVGWWWWSDDVKGCVWWLSEDDWWQYWWERESQRLLCEGESWERNTCGWDTLITTINNK